MKFKVGDRVIVYWRCNLFYRGAVVAVGDTGALSFVSDNEIALDVHPKQCRLLKKKERRRLWIDRNAYQAMQGSPTRERMGFSTSAFNNTDIEFIEVKKK